MYLRKSFGLGDFMWTAKRSADAAWPMPGNLSAPARCFATMVIARRLATWLHEMSHASIAGLLGYRNMHVVLGGPFDRASVTLDTAGPRPSALHASLIRHAGWIASVAVAAIFVHLSWESCLPGNGEGPEDGDGEDDHGLPAEAQLATLATVLVALEALHSDLLSSERPLGRFFCGNFGLLLLSSKSKGRVDALLRRMLKITMMRGAQSAGIVTYKAGRGSAPQGVRHRAVNGKRTDLSDKLLDKARSITRPRAVVAPQVFQGHTRFATSSIADLSGTHPHQWTPRQSQLYWCETGDGVTSKRANVEAYITHKCASTASARPTCLCMHSLSHAYTHRRHLVASPPAACDARPLDPPSPPRPLYLPQWRFGLFRDPRHLLPSWGRADAADQSAA